MPFTLRIFDGDRQRVEVREFQTNSVKVGRSETCDVVLTSPYVSREHALIRHEKGRFRIESVGRNLSYVNSQEIEPGGWLDVQPDDEIRIAEYSLYIEAPGQERTGPLDVATALGQLELEIHSELLERIDLAEARGADGKASLALRQTLDTIVRNRIPDEGELRFPEPVLEHALRESLYSEVIQEILKRTGGESPTDGARGFERQMDEMLARLVASICERLGIEGRKGSLRRDAQRVAVGFDAPFQELRENARPELKRLLVRRFLTREILNLVCGFGPLQDLLDLPNTSEIMVVHKDLIYIERDGGLERLRRSFITDDILLAVIQRIVEPLGRRIDRSTPLVDARLPDGSRVNAVIPPLAVKGPCLTIRRFSKDPLTAEDLIAFGSLTPPAVALLRASVKAHKNLIISGGTGSGKTSLLNVLSSFVGDGERIVTIEDSAELQLRQPHVVTLETRPPNVEGKGAYTIRDLVRNALRMRPDRVIVGECRGGEALDMLQAMNTGHDGSLTTLHANSPEDALLRLETMVLEAADLPVRAIREQIQAAVHVFVQTQRLPSGKRMVTHISEVVGLDPVEGVILTNDIFEERGGKLCFSGYLPSFMDDLVKKGDLDPQVLFTSTSVGAAS